MPLIELLSDFFGGQTTGAAFLQELGDLMKAGAERFSLPLWLLPAIGILLALTVGLLGLRLQRVLLAVLGAGLGLLAGCQAYVLLAACFPELPSAFEYVFGGLAALLFLDLVIAQKKLSWSLLALAISYAALFSLSPTSKALLWAAAVAIALLCGILPRTTFALSSGYLAAALCIRFVSLLLPHVTWLILGESRTADGLALVFGLVFAMLQLFATCRKKKGIKERKKKEKKPKKPKKKKKHAQ